MKRIRILLADDHSIVLEGLAGLVSLEEDMVVVGTAKNGIEAEAQWIALQPDVTLLDLRMPGAGRVEATYAIRRADPNAKIIILTTYDGDEEIYSAIRAGAKSYILKDASRKDVFACIRSVAKGQSWMPHDISLKLAQRVGSDQLTPRETEVLNLMARGKSNQEIGHDLFVSTGTVKTHIKSIFAKLNVFSRTEAIAVASKRGIVKL